MVDITTKTNTLRIAIAEATVQVSSQATIDAILNKLVPKGDVFEMSKAAGLLGIKSTSSVIPDCHPLPIEYAKITHIIDRLSIKIQVEVHTIYKTGVEVEAMYGASVTAITMYDMLKPIDKGVSISEIKLLSKAGGKTDFRKGDYSDIKASVIYISKGVYKGKKEDRLKAFITEKLNNCTLRSIDYSVILPEEKMVLDGFEKALDNSDLILFIGGTGLTSDDKLPEWIKPKLDLEIPGIMEYARDFGQERTPYSMFSRGFSGLLKNRLIIAIPGSTNGAIQSMEALFPYVLHGYKMFRQQQ